MEKSPRYSSTILCSLQLKHQRCKDICSRDTTERWRTCNLSRQLCSGFKSIGDHSGGFQARRFLHNGRKYADDELDVYPTALNITTTTIVKAIAVQTLEKVQCPVRMSR